MKEPRGYHHSVVGADASLSEQEFIELNIRSLITTAENSQSFEALGVAMGLPTDAEQDRLRKVADARRSWVAIAISILSLIVAISVAIFK